MELCGSFSRAWMRRKYSRIEGGSGFVVKRKRVKVANLEKEVAGPRRQAHRHNLRCFRLRFLLHGQLLTSLKEACMRLMHGGTKSAPRIAPPQTPGIAGLSKRRTLRSSSNEVVDEVWFNQALRRSIAEGRITIWEFDFPLLLAYFCATPLQGPKGRVGYVFPP